MLASIIGAIALKKSHHDAGADAARTPRGLGRAAATRRRRAPASASPQPTPPPAARAPRPAVRAVAPSRPVAQRRRLGRRAGTRTRSTSHVAPFGNGPVHHGNVLRLKMDGPIEAIEGAQQPTGFTVKIPGRKSLEAAAPLAARDSRIAAIKVANDGAGAELTVDVQGRRAELPGARRAATRSSSSSRPPATLDETMAQARTSKGGKRRSTPSTEKNAHRKRGRSSSAAPRPLRVARGEDRLARRDEVPRVALAARQCAALPRTRSSPRCPCSSRAAGTNARRPRAAPSSATRAGELAVGRDAAAEDDVAQPSRGRAASTSLRGERRRHGGLERGAHVGRAVAGVARHAVARRRAARPAS